MSMIILCFFSRQFIIIIIWLKRTVGENEYTLYLAYSTRVYPNCLSDAPTQDLNTPRHFGKKTVWNLYFVIFFSLIRGAVHIDSQQSPVTLLVWIRRARRFFINGCRPPDVDLADRYGSNGRKHSCLSGVTAVFRFVTRTRFRW